MFTLKLTREKPKSEKAKAEKAAAKAARRADRDADASGRGQ